MSGLLLHGMLAATAIGLVVCAGCVVIHGLGTTLIIHVLRKKGYEMLHGRSPLYAMVALILTTLWLLLLHILEIVLWAEVYLHTAGVKELHDIETALYFSAVTYTTLGYGDIVLHDQWRILSAIEAMSGIMLFGWSTALLFAVVREILRQVDPVALEYEKRVQLALRKTQGEMDEAIREQVVEKMVKEKPPEDT